MSDINNHMRRLIARVGPWSALGRVAQMIIEQDRRLAQVKRRSAS